MTHDGRTCKDGGAVAEESNTSVVEGKDVDLWWEQKQGWDFVLGLR